MEVWSCTLIRDTRVEINHVTEMALGFLLAPSYEDRVPNNLLEIMLSGKDMLFI